MEKAKETLLRFFGFIKGKWESASKNARIITLSVLVAVVISVITLVAIANRTDYEVLYRGVQSTEMSEIAVALREMGITNVRFDGDTISVPKEIADLARMEMAIQGFPRSTSLNYDIWNDAIGMFSTDAQTREIQKQQLETRIAATLRQVTLVQDAAVTITPPESRPYVLNPERRPSRTSVLLTLQPGVRLTSRQIEGIRNLVISAVPELEDANLTITNQDGIALIADEAGSIEEQIALETHRRNMQRQFERELEADLEGNIASVLTGTLRNFRIAVRANVDFNEFIEETVDYDAFINPETGMPEGIPENRRTQMAWNGIIGEDGMVGTAINADISPNFPTLEGEPGSEAFFEVLNDVNYLVNERKRLTTSNGYIVDRVSVAVQIDEGVLTGDQIDDYTRLIAFAAGTDVEYVMVMPTNFPLIPPIGDDSVVVAPNNALVFVIIALGAFLVVLFVLAIMSSGSKKRRLIKSRAAAFQGASPAFADEGFGAFPIGRPMEEEEDESLKIQSLLGSGEGETREGLLKNEIREFSKTNPDIVAQLIRTWIREDG
jgi:flagellar M-ring protein FliF